MKKQEFMYKLCKFVFWVSTIYIVASLVGFAIISIFRPDIKVVDVLPFLIAIILGTITSYFLGDFIYGKEK